MKLTLDLSTKKLQHSCGYAVPITELHLKYGEGTALEIEVVRDGIPITPTLNEQFKFIVKKQGVFAAAGIVAGIDAFTYDASIGCFVGEINFNVTAITSALHQAQGTQDQQDAVMFWAELEYRKDSSSGWQSSQLIKKFWIDNKLWKGTETIPGGGSDEPTSGPWLTPIVIGLTAEVVNAHATANTILDVSGLQFPVEAGYRYRFDFDIIFDAALTTTGSRWSIDGPAAPTELLFESEYSLTTTTVTTNRHLTSYDLPLAANGSSGWTTGNRARITGFIKPSATGFVKARFASQVGGSAITAKPGSCVTYVRVG